MCDISGLRADGGVRAPARRRPRLDAGHGRRGAARRRARTDLAEQAAGGALGRDDRGLPRAGLRSTSTVMFGHIEEPWELAEHMRVVRELQERTGGITEFVPLSFIPFQTLLGRTHGVEEISREENLKHTAVFRLALGRTIPSVQASWVKMGLDAATESLRWGVNDLGGTLMEESISRLAGSYHGTRLDPERAGRGRPRGRAPGRRAHDPVRDPPPLPAAELAATGRWAPRRDAARGCAQARANCPWKPNGMWWGSSARASSCRSAASSTSRNEAGRVGVEHDRQQHAVVLVLGARAAPRTPARPGSRPGCDQRERACRRSVSTLTIRSSQPPGAGAVAPHVAVGALVAAAVVDPRQLEVAARRALRG